MIMKKLLPLIIVPLLASACGDVFETDISKRKVEVIAPSDGAEVGEGSVSFRWNVLEGAERYRVTVVSPDFDNALSAVTDTIIYPDSLALGVGFRLQLTAADYQWSIQAFNHAYQSRRSAYDLNVTKKQEEPETEEQ